MFHIFRNSAGRKRDPGFVNYAIQYLIDNYESECLIPNYYMYMQQAYRYIIIIIINGFINNYLD